MTSSDTVTELLARWKEGREIHSRVMPLVYRDLRAIAGALFTKERRNHTLQPTGLVHEAYIRFMNAGNFKSRPHFFSVAAKVMRRTLVDHARRHNAEKRGGSFERVERDDLMSPEPEDCSEILAMDQALRQLKALHPRQCRVVELRYFAGLDLHEVAAVLRVGVSTVKEDWYKAKMWLKGHLEIG